MNLSDSWLLVLAGLGAGMINAVVGSGTLITYPVLISLGIPPVVANGTNTLGLAPGAVAGAVAYRSHLRGRKSELLRWGLATAAGGAAGALLVVLLPAEVFTVLVPWLIAAAVLVIGVQPWLTRKLRGRASANAITPTVALVGIYGGYFGAGQGVAFLAALGSLDNGDDLHRANAVKNVLAAAANGTAAVTFALAGLVDWIPALIIMAAAIPGGFLGGVLAKRLPQWVFRIVIICVGLLAAVQAFRMA